MVNGFAEHWLVNLAAAYAGNAAQAKRARLVMTFWQRVQLFIRRLLGIEETRREFLEETQQFPEIVRRLTGLAARQGRSQSEVTLELLDYALDQRRSAEEKLKCWWQLTPREREVVALVCQGYTNRDIAAHLVISTNTVKTHVRNSLRKFGLSNRTELRVELADWDFSEWK